jgi:ElaB/YqjD/DUF883 family membrane-anchored ribosome-binding protein
MEKYNNSRRNFLKNSVMGVSVFGLDFSMPNWLFSINTGGESGNVFTVASDITFIREKILLTQQLLDDIIAKQNISPSVNFITVRLVATTITLDEDIKVKKNVQFILVADDINGNGKKVDVSDLKINPDATVTGYTPKDCYFHAKRINGLTVNALGANGANGKDATVNFKMIESGSQFGKPDKFEAPGTGQNGGNGANGGTVHIMFTEFDNTIINTTGGKGGVGGKGGNPGSYCAEYDLANPKSRRVTVGGASSVPSGTSRPGGLGGGKPGSSGGTTWKMETYYDCFKEARAEGLGGNLGVNGKDGVKDVKKVSSAFWYKQAHIKCPNWSNYRVKLAEYYYRSVNNPDEIFSPQLKDEFMRNRFALIQVFEALALNPNNETAKLWKTRIYNGHTPIGIRREIDINPDFPFFQGEYTKLYGIVDSIQRQANFYASSTNMKDGFKEILITEKGTLKAFANSIGKQLDSINAKIGDRGKELKDRLSKDTVFNMAIKARQQEIANQPFTLNDLATTIGAVAGVVMAVYSGGTSLIGAYKNFMVLGEKTSNFLNALDSIDSLRDIGVEVGEYKNLSDPKSLTLLTANTKFAKGDRTVSDAPLTNNAFSIKTIVRAFFSRNFNP